jgi:hypothetical protein
MFSIVLFWLAYLVGRLDGLLCLSGIHRRKVLQGTVISSLAVGAIAWTLTSSCTSTEDHRIDTRAVIELFRAAVQECQEIQYTHTHQ